MQEPVYDDFVARFAEAIGGLRVGTGFETGVDVGPLIDCAGLEKVVRHVADAQERGAELVVGGDGLGGRFFQPTLLTGVVADAAMSCEETFGPVAGIASFRSEEEAIRIANRHALRARGVLLQPRDFGRVWRVAEALDFGILGINTGFLSTEVAPFGGMKESGMGREGSKYGLDDWLEIKVMHMGGMG